ncbi:MAG: hypothetical protein DSZ28_00540 [Thiothrix sp.]|nr:MAG: hypothetical protein DSZ28_00540 [Thiothrix sp.]
MGVEIDEYRCRIGTFRGGRGRTLAVFLLGLRFVRGMLAFVVLIVLLYIGGVERNPGPVTLESIAADMKETRGSILAVVTDIKSSVQHMQQDIKQIKEHCQRLDGTCEELKRAHNQLSDKLTSLEEEIVRVDSERHVNSLDIEELKTANDDQRCEIDSLNDEIDRLEAYSRRDSIRIFGMKESEDESHEHCTKSLVELLNKYFTFKVWKADDMVRAHRVGPQRAARSPRHVIAKFARSSDVASILKSREARATLREKGVRLAADLTRRQNQKLQELRERGQHGYFKAGKLVVVDGLQGDNYDRQRTTGGRRHDGTGYDKRPEHGAWATTAARDGPTISTTASDATRQRETSPRQTPRQAVRAGSLQKRPQTRSQSTSEENGPPRA